MHPPSVDSVANALLEHLKHELPKSICVDIARKVIEENKANKDVALSAEETIEKAKDEAVSYLKNTLTEVVNATGVLLHTNLGRAPVGFSQEPFYSNLELNLKTGERGSRQKHAADLFASLVGAEAGLIVNNCAAAITLILAALASGKGVAVSRGELVEIGGGFRVPEVIEASTAKLVEVGTTNRTRLKDYDRAIRKHSVELCLKVHKSNYTVKGFSESVSVKELSSLSVPVVVDLGSGLLDAACPWLEDLGVGPPKWLKDEPAAKQTLLEGADLVAFSGDKLLGGSQAGIILGNHELVKKCAKHPLARAFRPGTITISACRDLAMKYLHRKGSEIPFWQMATIPVENLKTRAKAICEKVKSSSISYAPCFSTTGGGTLPNVEIPSFGIHIKGADEIKAKLREFEVPIIARVIDDNTIIDMRTVLLAQDDILVKALKSL